MSVIRVEKNKNYTTMSNFHLRDENLSLKAKGLLSVVLSLPSDWDYSINGLVSILKENETAIKSTLNELKERKYLIVLRLKPIKDTRPHMEYSYTFYEKPYNDNDVIELINTIGEENLIEDDIKQLHIENLGVENLGVEVLGVEHQGQLNTNILNTNINNNIYRAKEKIENETAKNIENEFENLWKLYPRKKGKTKAKEIYTRIRTKNEVTYKQVEKGILSYITEIKKNKTEERFILHGSTFFNQKRWEDYTDAVDTSKQLNDTNTDILNKEQIQEQEDFMSRFNC